MMMFNLNSIIGGIAIGEIGEADREDPVDKPIDSEMEQVPDPKRRKRWYLKSRSYSGDHRLRARCHSAIRATHPRP